MTPLTDLIVPILVASLAVFVWSFVAWMVLPHHRADIKRLPNEDEALAFLKTVNRGNYLVPSWQGLNLKDPDTKARFMETYAAGPWALVRVTGKPNFAKNLALTYLVFLVVCAIVAYLTSVALAPGTPYLRVFQVAGAASLLGFAFGGLTNDIFFSKPARFVLTDLFDAVCYTLISAGVFAAMWPDAPALLG